MRKENINLFAECRRRRRLRSEEWARDAKGLSSGLVNTVTTTCNVFDSYMQFFLSSAGNFRKVFLLPEPK